MEDFIIKIRFWFHSRGSLEELRSQLMTNKALELGDIKINDLTLKNLELLSVKLNNTIQANWKQVKKDK